MTDAQIELLNDEIKKTIQEYQDAECYDRNGTEAAWCAGFLRGLRRAKEIMEEQ